MATAKITSKGQVTLPKSVRDALHLRSGDKIDFVFTRDREVLLRPVTRRVDEIFGILHRPGQKSLSVEEMNAAVRKRFGDK